MSVMTITLTLLMATLWLALAMPAMAADFPNKQILLLVGAPPGGPIDLNARLVGEKLTNRFHQSIVVENRPGAQGIISYQAVVRAAPDGYTLAMGSTGMISAKFMLASYTIDPVNGYTHIIELSGAPLVLTLGSAQPYKTLADLISYIKANPGKLNFGAFPGAVAMDVGVFTSLLKSSVNPIAYAGSAAQQQAVASGELPASFDNYLAAKPFMDAGKTRLLAVVSSKRFPLFGDLPAIGEQVPGFEGTVNWFSVVGPPGMPRDVVNILNAAINAGIHEPDVVKKLNDGAQEVIGGSPEDLHSLVAHETERMSRAAALLGIRPQ